MERTLIDFYADWCGPCQILGPTLDELASELKDVTFKKVNIDEEPELAREYNISSIPCLVLEEDGKEIDRSVGIRPKNAIKKFITKGAK